ncbi:diguanylate cyclase CdgB [soil metagenome]
MSGNAEPGEGAGGADLALVRREVLEEVLHTVRRLGVSRDVRDALEEITRAVTSVMGFEATTVNVVLPSGDLSVIAAAGPLPDGFVGSVTPRHLWDAFLDSCTSMGDLLFHSHEQDQSIVVSMPHHKRPHGGPTPPGNWDEDDALLAPLWHGNELVGVISVDEPRSGLLPDQEQRTVLELFAVQAAAVIAEANRRTRLGDEELLYRTVFERTPAPTAILQPSLDVLAVNAALGRQLVQPLDHLENAALAALIDPVDLADVRRRCLEVLEGGPAEVSIEHRLRRLDGKPAWSRTRITRVSSPLSGPRLVLTLQDITEARRLIKELLHQADRDMVTGLPNGAHDPLQAALGHRSQGQAVLVLSCGVDRVPAAGRGPLGAVPDEVLSGLARRLVRAVRPSDVVCRTGPAEFVVIALADLARTTAAASIARRCIDAVRVTVPAGSEGAVLSVGVVVVANRDVGASALLAAAGVALHEARRAGGGGWHLGSIGDPRG